LLPVSETQVSSASVLFGTPHLGALHESIEVVMLLSWNDISLAWKNPGPALILSVKHEKLLGFQTTQLTLAYLSHRRHRGLLTWMMAGKRSLRFCQARGAQGSHRGCRFVSPIMYLQSQVCSLYTAVDTGIEKRCRIPNPHSREPL
jgi:hypothetical protein